MSKLQVDDIVNKDDTGSVGFSRGAVVTGVMTATTFSGALTGNATGLTGTPNIDCGTGSFTGDVDIADKIIHTGDTNTALRFPAADTFTVETAGTERLRITSGGLIGINTTPGTLLELMGESSKEADITFNRQPVQGTNDGVIGQLLFENATDSVAQISVKRESAADDAYIQFATQATGGSYGERLRITSGGDVRIGTTNAVVFGSRRALTVANGTTGAVLSLYNSTTATNNPRISSNPGGSEINDIGIHAASTNGTIQFYTNNDTERLRLDSAGRLLHGTTSSSSITSFVLQGNSDNSASAAGIYMQRGTATPPDGQELGNIYFADSGGGTGALILAKRDGGTWSASSKPGRLEFHTTPNNATSGTERMRIHSGGVVSIPNGIELGSGVDATAANTLEDYEEGTFTPTVANFTVSGTTTLTGQYVKIGKQVTIGIKFANTGTIAHGVSAMVASLPFAMASGTEAHGLIGMLMNNNSEAFNSNQSGVQCKLDGEGGSRFFPGSFTTTSNGEQLIFGGTYIAAS